ncbi:MAG: lipid A deacylase LpxR family protein [Gammaproteobacteria bacterium]|nr:lipid A deacylase LpxR family protein [Gammaproteobacteria bacterium]
MRAYNAFLQGQFRDSVHTFDASDVQHVIGEAWVGVTGQLASGTTMSYTIRYQTAELRDGVGRRDPLWAGVTLTHSF